MFVGVALRGHPTIDSLYEIGSVAILELSGTLSDLHPVVKVRRIAFEGKEDFPDGRKLPERFLHLSEEIRTAATGGEVTDARCSGQISQVHIGISILDVDADQQRFRIFRKVGIKPFRLLITCWTSEQMLECGLSDCAGLHDRSKRGMNRH